MFDINEKTKQFEKDLIPILKKIKKDIDLSLANFNIKNGKFTYDKFSDVQLMKFNESFISSLKYSGYNKLVGKYLGKSRKYLTDRIKGLKTSFPELAEFNVKNLDSIVEINAGEFSLVGQDVAAKLQTRLANQLINGESLKDSTEILSGLLDKSLVRYSSTWLKTSYQRYIQGSEDALSKELGFGSSKDDIWEYVGAPLQKNSHSECVWALQTRRDSIFTTKEKKAFQNGTAYSSQPAPPRYSCQHYFIISSKSLQELAKDVNY